MGQPYVFPHGVTVYDPQKCWNGYTIVPLINDGVLLFDMNGNEVRRWNMHAMPPKLLPGGYVMGLSGYRHPDYGMQDGVNLIEIDYDGNIVWEFDKFGGGPEINGMLHKVGKQSRFVAGLRYTDEETMDVVQMVFHTYMKIFKLPI